MTSLPRVLAPSTFRSGIARAHAGASGMAHRALHGVRASTQAGARDGVRDRVRACASVAFVAWVSLVSLGSLSCGFVFPRLDDVPPGSINGRTVDAKDAVIAFSRIGLDSTARVARSLDDGRFQIEGLTQGEWLLRFLDDRDGDGAPEQSALRAVRIVPVTDPTGDEVLSSVLFGDVALDGTAVITGRVVDEDGAPVAIVRVVVYRNTAELDADQGIGDQFDVDLAVEQETATDSDGAFRLEGIGRGTVRIAAMTGDGVLASAPVVQALLPGDEKNVADIVLHPGGTRTVQVTIQNPPTDGSLTVDVLAHGSDRAAPDVLATTTVPAGRVVGGLVVPTTIVDAYVTDRDDAGAVRRQGALLGRVVAAGEDPLEIVLWGNVELVDADPCGNASDRDDDGFRALPDPAIDAAAWATCSSTCASAFGAALYEGDGALTCTVGGEQLDCDDDDDGQPDVTEPFACVSLCAGTDLDGDGACRSRDLFPQCAANDPGDETCSAEEHDFVPPDSLYEPGEGEGEGEVDDCAGQPTPTCDPVGSVVAFCQAHVEALAGCTAVGDLTIAHTASDLTPLSSLSSASTLSVQGTTLTSLAGLESLRSLDAVVLSGTQLADLTALSGTSVTTVSIGANDSLTSLLGINPNEFTTVVLVGNASLTDLSALAVPTLRYLDISATPALTSLSSLAGLETITEVFFLNQVPITDLSGLTLSSLGGGGSLLLQDMPTLTSLSALANTSLPAASVVINGTGISSLAGLNTTTISNLFLEANPNLTDVGALGGLTDVFTLLIDDNDALTSLGTFTSLTTAIQVTIQNNDALASAGSFPVLTDISSLAYSNQPALLAASVMSSVTSIDNISVTQTGMRDLGNLNDIAVIVGDLTITENDALTGLLLNPQLNIDGALVVTDNIALDHCLVEDLAGRATPSSTTNTGNLGGAAVCP